jgi:hypothetical protein
MKVRFHSPASVNWRTELDGDEKSRLQRAIFGAIRQAIENSAGEATGTVIADFEVEASTAENFSSDHVHPDRDI